MYEKSTNITYIVNTICSKTGMSFQDTFIEFLDIVCEYKGLCLDRVQPTNGDFGNDGWIPEKNIFFALSSPNDKKISQISEINKKLFNDLDDLCDNVFIKNKWDGKISKIYFIVNTHDQNMPADSDRLLNKTKEIIYKKYDKNFEIHILVAKDIKKWLLDQDKELIDKIANNFSITAYQDEDYSIPNIMNFISEYVKYIATDSVEVQGTNLHKIKTLEKIKINKLERIESRIEQLVLASQKVDKYLEYINSNGMSLDDYNKIKAYIIGKYIEFASSEKYSSTELYFKLMDSLVCNATNNANITILEAVVVGIFIRCDIFRKD